jgi:alpha-D-xyloside xylohydrolase
MIRASGGARSLSCTLALALGCGLACGNGQITLSREAFSLGEGRFLLQVSDEVIGLERDGHRLLTLDASSFQLGVTAEPSADRSWDPWDIEQRGEAASGVTFRSPIAWTAVARAAGRDAEIDLDYGGGLGARLAIAVVSASRFTLTLSPSDSGAFDPSVVLARVRVRTTGDPDEGFYGLGEQVDTVDNRGKLRPMQMELDDEVESKNNEVHVPVPLLIGTRGWGMFVASARVGVFDVARKDPSVVESTFAVASLRTGSRAEPLRVDLFAGDAPLDLYQEYYAASGAPRPPPPWALGPWIWRNATAGQAEVESDMAKIRDLDLATSGIWINRPYARAVNTFDFDPARFPEPQTMIDRAHSAGFRMALWSAPYLENAAAPLSTEATARGFFPRERGTLRNEWSPPIDFTSPQASAFWRGLVQRYTALGVDGFKLDYGEDLLPSLGSVRNAWSFSDGSDERTMHHRYSGLYHRVYADAAVGREPTAPVSPNPALPFLLVRAAHSGEQTLGTIVWPGEMDASFTRHKEVVVARDGTKVIGVGGLPTTVVMALSLSASGFPFFAADTGGYRHSPPDKELFVRWVEQSAMSTVMEVGDASNQPPWSATLENGRDAESLDIYRTYARLHMRLFPYEWSYALRLVHDGRPIQRPIGLAYPELGKHPNDEYMFGDELLVAPIIERGQTRRRVVVPAGTWVDFWDAAPFVADAHDEIDVGAPLGKLPLFVREGAIIPMLRPTIDTLSASSDPRVESFARDPGALWALIAPGPPRAFELWDGARVARTAPGAFEVKGGVVFDEGFVLELIATPEPAQIVRDEGLVPRISSVEVLDTAALGWTWSAARRGTLYIKLPPGPARIVVR